MDQNGTGANESEQSSQSHKQKVNFHVRNFIRERRPSSTDEIDKSPLKNYIARLTTSIKSTKGTESCQ